jgi:hypothetical protein
MSSVDIAQLSERRIFKAFPNLSRIVIIAQKIAYL